MYHEKHSSIALATASRYHEAMARVCCDNCRVLQPPAEACELCGHQLIELSLLARARVESVALVPQKPPSGWRDRLELWGTALGMAVGGGVLGHLTGSMIVFFVAYVCIGALGMYQQKVRAVLVRRPRLEGRTSLARPDGHPLIGTAVLLDRTLATPDGPALIITTTVWLGRRILLRELQACPFWLECEDRRVLVEPPLWFDSAEQPLPDLDEALRELGVQHLALDRKQRRAVTVTRAIVRPGAVLTALGAVVREQRPELGAYRDANIDVLKPSGQAPRWFEPAGWICGHGARILHGHGAKPARDEPPLDSRA